LYIVYRRKDEAISAYSEPASQLAASTDEDHPDLDLARVRAAAARLAGVAHRTPLLTSSTLNARCGASVFLKPEPFQRSGSFKFRGAYNRLSLLDANQRARGVVAYSSGNHGAAVALAAATLGISAVVVVPENGAPAKLAAIEGYGAQIRTYDPATERREEVAADLAAARSLTVIPPFDDYDVMAGQGTIGVELAEQSGGQLDLALVPVGGGGLAAGVSTAVTALMPGASVIGVEPAGADDTHRSLRAGQLVTVQPDTIADGLRAWQPGSLTFPVNQRLLQDVVTVTEEAIVEAMAFCFARLKVVVEPSGAVPLAALLSGAVPVSTGPVSTGPVSTGPVSTGPVSTGPVSTGPAAGRRVAVILSGGNIAPADFAAILSAGTTAAAARTAAP
jgi:threo-3-hydroxy-L-aspartate ammonia-lyase